MKKIAISFAIVFSAFALFAFVIRPAVAASVGNAYYSFLCDGETRLGDNVWLYRINESEYGSDTYYLLRCSYVPPEFIMSLKEAE